MSLVGRKCKVVHIHAGLDLIGSKISVHHKESEITLHENMIELKSRKTGREFFIPYANIKGGELLPAEAAKQTSPAEPTAPKRSPGRPPKAELTQ